MSDTHPMEERWPELKKAMETGGGQAVLDLIRTEQDPGQRLGLYSFAQGSFSVRDWKRKSFDAQIELVRGAMQDALKIADQIRAGGDDEKADRVADFANVLSYNLSADLAFCWPGDDRPRSKEHFEAGLAAAEECLYWRRILKKSAAPFAMAWWAKGIHELFLGRHDAALESMQEAQETGREASKDAGRSTEIDADASFLFLINAGALALAELCATQLKAQEHYDLVIQAFVAQKQKRPAEAEDAQFGIDQLELAKARLLTL
jgi:hypothetical protein